MSQEGCMRRINVVWYLGMNCDWVFFCVVWFADLHLHHSQKPLKVWPTPLIPFPALSFFLIPVPDPRHKITFQEEIDRNFPLAARLIGRGNWPCLKFLELISSRKSKDWWSQLGGSMDAQFIILFISFISSLSTKTHKTRIVSFLLCSFAAWMWMEVFLLHRWHFQSVYSKISCLSIGSLFAGGRNVKHIHKETGAWVWLCGRGSGFKDRIDLQGVDAMYEWLLSGSNTSRAAQGWW